MDQIEVYLVSDYNPKYLDGSIVSVIRKLISEVKSEESTIENFNINVEDKVKGLSQNSAKVVLNIEITTSAHNETELVETLNGSLRQKISSQAIYSVTAASSEISKKYAY
jgi:hypothetical protein